MVRNAAALGRTVRAEDGVSEALRWLRIWGLLPPHEGEPAHFPEALAATRHDRRCAEHKAVAAVAAS
jgi:hypothetical protein